MHQNVLLFQWGIERLHCFLLLSIFQSCFDLPFLLKMVVFFESLSMFSLLASINNGISKCLDSFKSEKLFLLVQRIQNTQELFYTSAGKRIATTTKPEANKRDSWDHEQSMILVIIIIVVNTLVASYRKVIDSVFPCSFCSCFSMFFLSSAILKGGCDRSSSLIKKWWESHGFSESLVKNLPRNLHRRRVRRIS